MALPAWQWWHQSRAVSGIPPQNVMLFQPAEAPAPLLSSRAQQPPRPNNPLSRTKKKTLHVLLMEGFLFKGIKVFFPCLNSSGFHALLIFNSWVIYYNKR